MENDIVITLTLSIDQVNLILEALGNRPFAEVFELVGLIQQQATEQLDVVSPSGDPVDD